MRPTTGRRPVAFLAAAQQHDPHVRSWVFVGAGLGWTPVRARGVCVACAFAGALSWPAAWP